MNIRRALEWAERFLNEGNIETTEALISYAESYLKINDPDETLETPIFCCFIIEDKIIHCGTEKEPLFPGTQEERIELCKACRKWCRLKIKELKEKIGQRK